MIKKLLEYLNDKRILILGFGKEGESTYKLLRKYFPEKNLFIADKNMNLLVDKIELVEDPYLEVSLGENYLNGIEEYDLIINTIPSLIIDEELLHYISPSSYILDIASYPGGVDYEKSKEYGIKAFLLPSLPLKFAPKTSGIEYGKAIERGINSWKN